MPYKYSICYPDKKDIVYFESPISGDEVLEIANKFDWTDQLKLAERIDQNNVFWSPSIEFICMESKRSFTLTADFNDKNELEFSLWYDRPKKVKILFGLLGETEKMVVDDVWNYSFNEAIEYLKHFVNKNFQVIENLYK